MNADITFGERKLLSCLRSKPGIFIGTAKLSYLEHFIHGYDTAMNFLGIKQSHNILPEGFDEYIALKFLGTIWTPKNSFDLILENSFDEENAFDTFFGLLDEYLLVIKFQPIPLWDDETDSIEQIKAFIK